MSSKSPSTQGTGISASSAQDSAPLYDSYESLKSHLLTFPPPLLPPSPSSPNSKLRHAISSLLLHPCLETCLHLLNHDLPSAHFLVRHMQGEPQWEAMMLHAILHRIEGDYENARAWYSDVGDSEVFERVWDGSQEKVGAFLDRVEKLRKGKRVDGRDRERKMEELGKESKREIQAVLEFCEQKFGREKWSDVSGEWVQDEKHAAQANGMVVGGEGWRQF